MTVIETFFSIGARDMGRASGFYVEALGAVVVFTSPGGRRGHHAAGGGAAGERRRRGMMPA
jgi:hypothetical protein